MSYAIRLTILATCLAAFAAPAAAQSRAAADVISLDSLLNVDVSTAARHAQKIRQAPASVTVITREEIVNGGYRTLADALGRVRGFYTSDDRNYTYLGIRGFSRPTDYNNRVLLLVDGQPINEGMYGSAPVGGDLGLDLAIVERIEVARGPASALYGTSAMLGVVNIITREATDLAGVELSAQSGSFGARAGTLTAGTALRSGTAFLLSGSLSDSDGEDLYFPEFDTGQTDGMARGLDWERRGHILASARHGGLSVRAWYGGRSKGVPTASWGTSFAGEEETFDGQAQVRARWQARVARDIHVDTDFAYDWYGYDGAYPEGAVVSVDSTDARKLSFATQASWDMAAAHRITVGGSYERHARADLRAWTDGERWFADDFPFSTWGIYAQHEATLSRAVTLTAGLRHDRGDAQQATTTPRAALLWSPSQRRTFKALYGEAFRAPNAYERSYWDGTDFKRAGALHEEHVRTWELVWDERIAEWLRGEVSLYRYDIHGLIDTEVDPADGLSYFVNRDHAATSGIEVELEARMTSGATAWANYAFQDAHDAQSGRRLTNSPAHTARAGATLALGHHLGATVEGNWESDRITLAGATVGGGVLARAHLRFQATSAFEVWAGADNVFDVERYVPAGYEHVQDALPQPRRALRTGVRVRF